MASVRSARAREATGPAGLDKYQLYYFDKAQSHEVLTAVEPEGKRVRVSVVSGPYGSRETRDLHLDATLAEEEWEVALILRELEARLAASGEAYFRVEPWNGSIRPLALTPASADDHLPHPVAFPGDAGRSFGFQLHHRREDEASRLFLAVPRLDLEEPRAILARLDFRYPHVPGGEVRILHARLGEGPLRHAWVTALASSREAGFRRLATAADYAIAFGKGWRAEWPALWRLALDRVLEGEEAPLPPPGDLQPDFHAPDLATALASEPARRVLAELAGATEVESALRYGEFGVKRLVAAKRVSAKAAAQEDLSLLEAILLVDVARRRGRFDLAVTEGERVIRLVKLRTP